LCNFVINWQYVIFIIMMKKHKKEISIDALAGMVQRGFGEIKKEQNKVEQSIRKEMRDMENRINVQFADLEGKIQTYTSFWHRKFSEHEIWLQNLDRSVASIERQLKK